MPMVWPCTPNDPLAVAARSPTPVISPTLGGVTPAGTSFTMAACACASSWFQSSFAVLLSAAWATTTANTFVVWPPYTQRRLPLVVDSTPGPKVVPANADASAAVTSWHGSSGVGGPLESAAAGADETGAAGGALDD